PGDVIALPPGTIHAIGAGIVVAEIQQNSDLTFRVYDYNRMGLDGKPRAMHVRESLETIQFGAPRAGFFREDLASDKVAGAPRGLGDGARGWTFLDGKYFNLRKVELRSQGSFTESRNGKRPSVW